MKNRNRYIPSVLIFLALIATGCSKKQLETIYSNQENRIDSFIQSQLSSNEGSVIIYNNGSNRLILSQGEGEGLKEGGSVSFYYAGYVFEGSINQNNLFATNHQATAEAAGWTVTDGNMNVKTMTLDDSNFISGLKNGLEGVKNGEICYIVFSGKYGFGPKQIGTIPANSALVYQIWVEDVVN